MPNLKERLLPHYLNANRMSRGSLDVVRIAIKNFGLARGAEAAASLAVKLPEHILPYVR